MNKTLSPLRTSAFALALLTSMAVAATDHPPHSVDYPSQIGPAGVETLNRVDATLSEATKRAALTQQPLAAGATVVEAGYYRAIGSDGKTGRSVTLLPVGSAAPTQKQLGEKGQYFAPQQWQWMAEAHSVTRAHVGAPCPKSGRWIAEVPMDANNFSHYQDVTVTCEAGATLPTLNIGEPLDDARVRWAWVGPAGDHKHAMR